MKMFSSSLSFFLLRGREVGKCLFYFILFGRRRHDGSGYNQAGFWKQATVPCVFAIKC